MATSNRPTTQYPSTHFLESCGVIAFHLSTKRIVLISRQRRKTTQWFLAKGRRNISESRLTAALREVHEETGYTCRALPVTLDTRAPPAIETPGFTPDKVRVYKDVTEPFMMALREIGEGQVKVIWWFVAAVDEAVPTVDVDDVETEGVGLFSYDEAVEKATFEGDREILRRAISLVEGRGGAQAD